MNVLEEENNCMNNKKNVNRLGLIIIAVMYVITFLPYFYSIYYAVPASDDFAMTLGRDNYSNAFNEFIKAIPFYWTKRGGGILWFAIQILLNPLNLHVHLGHTYGLYMICNFMLYLFVYMYTMKTILEYHFNEDNKLYIYIIILLTFFMFLQNNYYVEVYNWYVGMNAYALPLATAMCFITFMIKYSSSGKRRHLLLMLMFGAVTSNAMAYCVLLGVSYIYIVVYKKGFDGYLTGRKKMMPLFLFIIIGFITVFAPGNFSRQKQYVDNSVTLISILKYTFLDIIYSAYTMVRYRPWTLIVGAIVVYISFVYGKKTQKCLKNMVVFGLCALLACFGCVFPYVYGRSMQQIYMDVRMQFYVDILVELSFALICVMFGELLYLLARNEGKRKNVKRILVLLIGLLFFSSLATGNMKTSVTIDLLQKSDDIAKSYRFWDGILKEIESSKDEDVVIYRNENVVWNKYFLYSGIEPGEKYAIPLDVFYDANQILPNVYYKKKSLVVNYPRL